MTSQVRATRLQRNQSAGWFEETTFRTVHQRPPKNIAPSEIPISRASTRLNVLVMAILLFLQHLFVFLVHPMPGIEAADCEADNQQRQRPGMTAGMMAVQPDTQTCARKGRDRHRPADETHHPQAEPNALGGIALRPLFTRHFRRDLPA